MKSLGTYTWNEPLAEKISDAMRWCYSDKVASHCFQNAYANVLLGKEISKLLEIGIFTSETGRTSLHGWAKVFLGAQIFGGDIQSDRLFNEGRIKTCYVDQSDSSSLTALKSEFGDDFDVIIDDASNVYSLTVNTFEALFPALKAGGIYVIENCQPEHEENREDKQTVAALEAYLSSNNYDFDTFETAVDKRVASIDESTQIPTFENAPGDHCLIVVYKK